MRQITKEIQVYIDGSPLGFRLTKPDAAQGSDLFFRVFLPAGPDKPECIILIILRKSFYSNTAVLKLTPLPD